MQSSRILLLAKTFVMVYTLGNDQAADMLQNMQMKYYRTYQKGKNRKAQSFILSCLEKKLMIRFKN